MRISTVGGHVGRRALGVVASTVTVTPPVTGPPTYTPNHTWVGIGGRNSINHVNTFGPNGGPAKIIRLGAEGNSIMNSTTGAFQWSNLDQQIATAFNAGLEVLLHISYSPLYLTSTSWVDKRVPDPDSAEWDPFVADWSDMAKAVVNRYHKDGTAKANNATLVINSSRYVRFYEVWNEQNHDVFWRVGSNSGGLINGPRYAGPYAQLLAATYNKIKSISADALVSNGGYGGTKLPDNAPQDDPLGRGGRRIKSWLWAQDCLDYWVTTGYTKHANGWAAVPQDFICAHPYAGHRPGANNTFANQLGPAANFQEGEYANGIPAIHNRFARAGFPQLKVWGTEAGRGFAVYNSSTVRAVDGYGVQRFVNGSWTNPSTAPGGTSQTAGERKIASPAESYQSARDMFQIWQGLRTYSNPAGKWPTGSNLETWDIGNQNCQQALGPLWWFSAIDFNVGGSDFYEVPYAYEEHYGLLNKEGTPKRRTGIPTAYDFFMNEL